MNVILEGPDGSGKSTLARYLSTVMDMPIQAGEGPPKFLGEILHRVTRYAQLSHTIFDRHPVISQPIYTTIREDNQQLPQDVIDQFYASRPIIIYCRATVLTNHEVKAYDTPAHLAAIDKNWTALTQLYDNWAVSHANMIYRIGDIIKPIAIYLLALTGKASLTYDSRVDRPRDQVRPRAS